MKGVSFALVPILNQTHIASCALADEKDRVGVACGPATDDADHPANPFFALAIVHHHGAVEEGVGLDVRRDAARRLQKLETLV
jgi:hypothetical protein